MVTAVPHAIGEARQMVRHRWTRRAAAVFLALTGVAATAGTAGAAEHPGSDDGVTVIASGLEGPFGLSARYENIFVAESGTGSVVRVNPETGDSTPVITGLK